MPRGVPPYADTPNVNVRVNVLEYWEIGATKVHPCRWGTDFRVRTRHVLHLLRGRRARWQSEKATSHTLKTQGDNCEHTYGHGEQHRSVVFALLLLAFLVDQPQQLCCALLQAVWAQLGSTRLLWERMRALFEALLYGFEKSRPLLSIDSSSTPPAP